MSELLGTHVRVTMQARPILVSFERNKSVEAFLGEPTIHRLEIDDFVFQAEAERVRKIWMQSLSERSTAVFQEVPNDLSADERVILAAKTAADKIDTALLAERVKHAAFPIPERYDLILHPKDVNIRRDTIETLVPFSRIRQLLLEREALGIETREAPLGMISFSVAPFISMPKSRLN